MKKIIFILCTVLANNSFADDQKDNYIDTYHCGLMEDITRSIYKDRQNGLKPAEIEKKTRVFREKVYETFKKDADATTDKETASKILYAGELWANALSNYRTVELQAAFLDPIQPTQKLKDKVIAKASEEAYLRCVTTASEAFYNEHKNIVK